LNGNILYIQQIVSRGSKELQSIARKIENKIKEFKSRDMAIEEDTTQIPKEPLRY
jgi:hypothetical protein